MMLCRVQVMLCQSSRQEEYFGVMCNAPGFRKVALSHCCCLVLSSLDDHAVGIAFSHIWCPPIIQRVLCCSWHTHAEI